MRRVAIDCVPNADGLIQWNGPAAVAPGAGAAVNGLTPEDGRSSMPVHCGAERPNWAANSGAASSNLA